MQMGMSSEADNTRTKPLGKKLAGILQTNVNLLAMKATGKHRHHADIDHEREEQRHCRFDTEIGNCTALGSGCVDCQLFGMCKRWWDGEKEGIKHKPAGF